MRPGEQFKVGDKVTRTYEGGVNRGVKPGDVGTVTGHRGWAGELWPILDIDDYEGGHDPHWLTHVLQPEPEDPALEAGRKALAEQRQVAVLTKRIEGAAAKLRQGSLRADVAGELRRLAKDVRS